MGARTWTTRRHGKHLLPWLDLDDEKTWETLSLDLDDEKTWETRPTNNVNV